MPGSRYPIRTWPDLLHIQADKDGQQTGQKHKQQDISHADRVTWPRVLEEITPLKAHAIGLPRTQ